MAPVNQTAERADASGGDDRPQPQAAARQDAQPARPSIDWLMLFDD